MLVATLCFAFHASHAQAAHRPFVHFAPTTPDADAAQGIPWCQAPGLGWDRPAFVSVKASYLEQKLKEFTGEVAVRIDGRREVLAERSSSRGLATARAWLRQQYTELGFDVSEHGGWGGTNFIAEKAGTEPGQVVILSSHMDAVNGAPGADDDGAGTVTALAVAKELAKRKFRHTLRVVAFDQEEWGLVGSAEYVAHLKERGEAKQVIADIQLEMTGYNPNKAFNFHVIDCNKKYSRALSARVMDAVDAYELPLQRVPGCTDASDHASFWSINRPAIVISENFFGGEGNPCYHSSCDRVDILDFEYMAFIGQAAGGAVASLLGPVDDAL